MPPVHPPLSSLLPKLPGEFSCLNEAPGLTWVFFPLLRKLWLSWCRWDTAVGNVKTNTSTCDSEVVKPGKQENGRGRTLRRLGLGSRAKNRLVYVTHVRSIHRTDGPRWSPHLNALCSKLPLRA